MLRARLAEPAAAAGTETLSHLLLHRLRQTLRALAQGVERAPLRQQGQGQGDMNDLDRAGEAMGEAESSLGEGNADSAVGSRTPLAELPRAMQAIPAEYCPEGY